jgi:HK97 family phage major capsid protein
MKWIGHTIPVPESVLSDIPQLLGFINEFMIYGVREELEDQFITGDGLGENLTGILATVGIQTQAFSTSMIESLRKAKTKAKKLGRVTRCAAILTPENLESIELTLDAEDRYLLGGPVGTMTMQLWGMPIVENEGVTANHAIVGDFAHAIWFDRLMIEVATFMENRDFIEKNLVAIRARTRAQFGVTRPKAFVDVSMA